MLSWRIVEATHLEQILQHGGSRGDKGLIDSALARAVNKWQYKGAEVFALAAAYGFGIALGAQRSGGWQESGGPHRRPCAACDVGERERPHTDNAAVERPADLEAERWLLLLST